MNRMNLGCGPDLKQGWINVDSVYREGIDVWDIRHPAVPQYLDQFDFILVNHVFCTMDFAAVKISLQNIREVLRPGGILQVIDMDLLKAFEAYQNNDGAALPADGKTIDEKLCNHISGFGTRKSLYTRVHLSTLLQEAGFQNVIAKRNSEHDLRPAESLIVEAQR